MLGSVAPCSMLFLFLGIACSSALAAGLPKWQPELLRIEWNRAASSPRLDHFLQHTNEKIVSQATRTVGRIGAMSPLPADRVATLQKLTAHSSALVRAEAAYALGAYREGSETEREQSRIAIATAYSTETDALARTRQLFALGRIGSLTDDFSEVLKCAKTETQPAVRSAALMALYELASRAMGNQMKLTADDALIDSLVDWMIQSDDPDTEVAAQVIYNFFYMDSAMKTRQIYDRITEATRSARLDRARNWLTLIVSTKTPEGLQAMLAAGRDASPSVRSAYAGFKIEEHPDLKIAIGEELRLLGDPEYTVRSAATMGLLSMTRKENAGAAFTPFVAPLVTAYGKARDIAVRANLLSVLVKIAPTRAEPLVRTALKAHQPEMRARATETLGSYAQTQDRAFLARALTGTHPLLTANALLALMKAGETYLDDSLRAAIGSVVSQGRPEVFSSLSDLVEWSTLSSTLVAAVRNAYPVVKARGRVSLIVQLLDVCTKMEASAIPLDLVEDALRSPHPAVARSAHAAYKKATGQQSSLAIPAVGPVEMTEPTIAEIKRAYQTRYRVQTTRGSYVIRLREDTPFAAVAFSRAVDRHAFDQTTIDWTYANYKQNFGDVSGGASAGYPLPTFREELGTPFDHRYGTMSFINDGAPDNHTGSITVDLTYRFYDARQFNTETSFATIESGMKVVESVQLYDRIIGIKRVR